MCRGARPNPSLSSFLMGGGDFNSNVRSPQCSDELDVAEQWGSGLPGAHGATLIAKIVINVLPINLDDSLAWIIFWLMLVPVLNLPRMTN